MDSGELVVASEALIRIFVSIALYPNLPGRLFSAVPPTFYNVEATGVWHVDGAGASHRIGA